MSDKETREMLDSPIPRDVVSERSSWSGGPTLSYLEGWYVIDRLNKVFGQGNWNYKLVNLNKTFEGEVSSKFYVSYVSTVELTVTFDHREISFVDVGFGDGQDKSNPGKSHELAVKESVTDGIKRCAKSLGMSMGLALYDKTQEFVSDDTKTESIKLPTSVPTAAVIADANSHKREDKKPAALIANTAKETPKAEKDAAAVRGTIKSSVRGLEALKRLSIPEFKSKFLDSMRVSKVDELTLVQAENVLKQLRETYKELPGA